MDVTTTHTRRHGCHKGAALLEGALCGEAGGAGVAAEVVALVFVGDVVVPVGAGVAAGVDGAQPEHGLGAGQAPAGSGDAHPVLDQVAAGAFDDPGGDRPPAGEGAGVVHPGLLGVQVVQGRPDDFVVFPAGPGRVAGGELPDPLDDVTDPAVQDVQPLRGHPVV